MTAIVKLSDTCNGRGIVRGRKEEHKKYRC